MGKWLIRMFVKNHKDTKNPSVRDSYGRLAGVVGIVTNTLLCVLKIGMGLMFHSIAILADGINNLTDASSSAILLIGIRLSSRPADADHPYGHARIEYITGLIISFIIMVVGFQLLLQSIDRIRYPQAPSFQILTIVILLLAIGVKVWQAMFNLHVGKRISSATIKAAGADSRNDVISTAVVLLSLLVGHYTGLHVDGIMGCLVALFIMYSGFQLILETASPLMGTAPDPELVEEIRKRILSHKEVIGIHDLVVHNYGPGRTFASVHIEVDGKGDLIASHDAIDNIERAVAHDLKIQMVAHMDPLDIRDPLTIKVREDLDRIIASLDGVREIHDLRVVAGYTHQNIVFDVLVGTKCDMKESELKKLLDQKLKEISPQYFSVITIDRSYSE
jgi:cation diffusion facilitator family transporter